jgi:myo-inositol-1(or 4)-monophosphatase
MDHRELLDFAARLADAAAAETLPRFRTGLAVSNKKDGGFDPVTAADREAETAIRRLIEDAFPDDGILGEEHGEKASSNGRRWVLDPVDGTRAFICGVPVWTTLIALEEDGAPVLGVIDQPFLKERWIGLHRAGADPLFQPPSPGTGPSGCRRLGEARMMVTDLREGEYFSAEEALRAGRAAKAARLCRQGLDSYGFGLVASGHMDLVVEAALNWFDIAAVLPVIAAAGGTVTSWSGEAVRAKDGPIDVVVAATPALAGEAVEALRA